MPNNTQSLSSNRGDTFALPDIPVVSKFDDWSQVLPLSTSITRGVAGSGDDGGAYLLSSASVKSSVDQYEQQVPVHTMRAKQLETEVAPPLVFLSYPPAIFDLLKSDTDDRIVIWGPDPQAVSASEATTPMVSTISKTSASPPSNVGFSSNTTSSTAPTLSIHSAHSTNDKKPKRRWINKVKQSIHPSSSGDHHQSLNTINYYDEKKGLWIDHQQQKPKHNLRSRFGRQRSTSSKNGQQQHSSLSTLQPSSLSSSHSTVVAPKVIEAATVEKLVEKLTVTLDYTFMTDFFLTYRTFISPTQLCKLLILRFRWGLENNEDDRCIVRIRTFVVIRHWLLNYFVHDYTPSRELREILTMFLNALPSHPLIKHSPRDQRIVKGLKRVVRRLKKVHYPRSSQHVQVISPPPPVFDEVQVRHMVHAKLSQSPLRRKTEGLIQKGMAVEDRHHGNVAFQDARMAEIVVIGSSDKSPLPPSTPQPPPTITTTVAASSPIPINDNDHLHPSSLPVVTTTHHQPEDPHLPSNSLDINDHVSKRNRNVSQNSIAKYATSAFARGRHHQQELQRARVKESYLRRMEQQKRMLQQENQLQPQSTGTDLDCHQQELHSHRSSVISDASLESLVSPGTTDDELYDDDEDDDDEYETDDSSATDSDEDVINVEQPHHEVPATAPPPTPIHATDDDATQQSHPSHMSNSKASSQHRRSVYNAELSDLSPLVSPNGSALNGPLLYRPNGDNFMNKSVSLNDSNKQQTAQDSSMQQIDDQKADTSSTATTGQRTKGVTVSTSSRRVSWNNSNNNRLSKSFAENDGEKMALNELPTQEGKVLVESPTSILSAPTRLSTHEEQVGPVLSSVSTKPQRKLSKRLIKAFRSAGNIRSGRTTATQPEMTTSSTAASSISHSSISAAHQRQHHITTTPASSQLNKMIDNDASWEAAKIQHHHTHQQPNFSHFEDLRTSLDEILPPSVPPHDQNKEQDEKYQQQRQQQQQQQQRSQVIELDIPRWGSSDITPSPTSLFRSSPMVLQHRSHSLAQQLCLVEKWVLLQVDWEEMVHCRWTKMGNHSSMTEEDDYRRMDENGNMIHMDDDHHVAATYYSRQTRQLQLMRGEQEGGVQQLIKRFNTVCQWVSGEIVRTPSLDDRVLVIEKFIRLAQKCQTYSNFATLVQILLGLQSPSVSRLRKTWARVADSEMRLLEQLSSFTSPMKNWKHIRDNMTVVAEEYGMSPKEVQIQLPGSIDRQLNQPKIKLPFGGCIPFLGLYLSDLVFNSEQPSYLEPSHDHHKIYQSYTKTSTNISPLLRQPLVNFRKHRIIATIIKRFLTFRDLASRYSFEQLDPLYSDCFHLEALETETIRQLSLIIEPPPLST
ncbi:unnamed protein product [Absidia cylindrospora]